ncbi:molecular chaperone [Luteimonas weifangensis]|uniref:Molecular chaperone n=2 Tax=Cognatiluteimonas weifangensis TaxID=2303539 RepID=A0A372DQQ6_9GAMM|nr:molecular chaperone [Luteimonas weifangensis]
MSSPAVRGVSRHPVMSMRLLPLVLALLAFALPARAAEFELSPTRVRLDARHLVDTVQVGNSGATPLQFEVSVSSWRMGDDGAWQLAPSDDLIVHPLLLEIAPGSKARLRVGLLLPPTGPGEAAYRIELQEQPAAAATAAGSGVRMLTKISLPVFVAGSDAGTPAPVLQAPRWRGDALAFVLRNAGEAFLPPQTLTLQLLAADGSVLQRRQLQGNYVLAGASLPLRVQAAAALCARTTALVLRLEDTGTDLRLPLSARHCVP